MSERSAVLTTLFHDQQLRNVEAVSYPYDTVPRPTATITPHCATTNNYDNVETISYPNHTVPLSTATTVSWHILALRCQSFTNHTINSLAHRPIVMVSKKNPTLLNGVRSRQDDHLGLSTAKVMSEWAVKHTVSWSTGSPTHCHHLRSYIFMDIRLFSRCL